MAPCQNHDNMDSASQWVSRMCRLFFADEYARHTEGPPAASHAPNMESAFQAVENALPKLENRVIEFLAEWLVALFAPAKHVLARHTHSCCSKNTGLENFSWVSK